MTTGKSLRKLKKIKAAELELEQRVVAIKRVAKVTKGGRTFGFAATVVVGNKNGIVGHGHGKAREVSLAISKAVDDAKKNLIQVPLKGTTVPHEQWGKFGAARVFIKPAVEGTGVIAGGSMRAVLECAGIHNVLCKSMGSSTPENVVKATIDALVKMRTAEEVARARGISLQKVFNG